MTPTILGLLALLLLFVLIIALLLVRRRRRSEAAPEPAKKPRKAKVQPAPTQAQADEPSPTPKPKRKPQKQSADDSTDDSTERQPVRRMSDSSIKILGSTDLPGVPPLSNAPVQAYAPAGEKIRILLVDDNTGTRENVSRLLFFEDDLEVIGQAVNGRQGVEMTVEMKPHIVLMDINMPDMDGITATQRMAEVAPYSQVIIMSVQSDPHYMRRAMSAGARDFQPKPFTSQELVSTIRRVYNIGLPTYRQIEAIESAKAAAGPKAQSASAAAKGQDDGLAKPVVVVYSPKGGVGTSAIAVNLAVLLHQARGNSVLLDGALQFGDISVHLNTRPTRTLADTLQGGDLEVDLVEEVLLAHSSGLKLLLAPPQPEFAESISSGMLAAMVDWLRHAFNTVIIDTTCKLSDEMLRFIDAATVILVVTTPELPSIKSAKLFLELAEELKLPEEKIMVVINRAGIPGGIQPGQINRVLNIKHSHQIPYDSKMHFSLNKGIPICLDAPSSPSSLALTAIAKEVIALLEPRDDFDFDSY
jgi:pilus assembly protein CpaE